MDENKTIENETVDYDYDVIDSDGTVVCMPEEDTGKSHTGLIAGACIAGGLIVTGFIKKKFFSEKAKQKRDEKKAEKLTKKGWVCINPDEVAKTNDENVVDVEAEVEDVEVETKNDDK